MPSIGLYDVTSVLRQQGCLPSTSHRCRVSSLMSTQLCRQRARWICTSKRHADIMAPKTGPVIVKPREDQEADFRYRRADMSSLHAYSARWRFMHNIARGEPGMQLAEAALLVAAEDDAIASHSTVAFPVDSYIARIQKLADEFDQQRLQPLLQSSSPLEPSSVLSELEDYLYQGQHISVPAFGRSNLPPNSLLDHPGVWEDARWAYLNELLIRKRGHPAAVAILYAEVMRRLLSRGSVDFAVAMDTRGFNGYPKAVVLHGMTRDMLMKSAQSSSSGTSVSATSATSAVQAAGSTGPAELMALNTCTSDTLAELLRHLKRSYWPLPWDTAVDSHAEGGRGSSGGFKAAIKAACGDEIGAQLRAVSKVANWRLERGVWTSPGAGDIRRCRAACERLVLLGGEGADEERRDLAVILLHCGELASSYAELAAYMDTQHFRVEADGIEKVLCQRMMQILKGITSLEACSALTLEGALAGPTPEEVELVDRKMPLTW